MRKRRTPRTRQRQGNVNWQKQIRRSLPARATFCSSPVAAHFRTEPPRVFRRRGELGRHAAGGIAGVVAFAYCGASNAAGGREPRGSRSRVVLNPCPQGRVANFTSSRERHGAPRPLPTNALRRAAADDAFREGVVRRLPTTPDGRVKAGGRRPLRVANREIWRSAIEVGNAGRRRLARVHRVHRTGLI